MAVRLKEPEQLLSIKGVRMAAMAAGIKSKAGKDLVLFELQAGSQCTAVFYKECILCSTGDRVKTAPC